MKLTKQREELENARILNGLANRILESYESRSGAQPEADPDVTQLPAITKQFNKMQEQLDRAQARATSLQEAHDQARTELQTMCKAAGQALGLYGSESLRSLNSYKVLNSVVCVPSEAKMQSMTLNEVTELLQALNQETAHVCKVKVNDDAQKEKAVNEELARLDRAITMALAAHYRLEMVEKYKACTNAELTDTMNILDADLKSAFKAMEKTMKTATEDEHASARGIELASKLKALGTDNRNMHGREKESCIHDARWEWASWACGDIVTTHRMLRSMSVISQST